MSETNSTDDAEPQAGLHACLSKLHALREQMFVVWSERESLNDRERVQLHQELARTCRLLQALTAGGDNSPSASPVQVTEDHLDSLLLARRARADIVGADLFSDPAWDILLELYAAKLGARAMTAVELARAIRMPTTTTIRWIAALQDHGLVTIPAKGTDDECLSLTMTEAATSRMKGLAQKWATAFVSI